MGHLAMLKHSIIATSKFRKGARSVSPLTSSQKRQRFYAQSVIQKKRKTPFGSNRLLNKHTLMFECIEEDKFNHFFIHKFTVYARDCDVKNLQGKTPLFLASELSNVRWVRFLLNKGANPNQA